MWPSNSTPVNIPRSIEIRGLGRYLHTRIHGTMIHNWQKVEATQAPINRWTDKQTVVYPGEGIWSSLKEEEHSDTCYMNEVWRPYAQWNKTDTKGKLLHDPTCMKYPEYANSKWQEIDPRWSGAGRRGSWGVIDSWVQSLFGEDEKGFASR